MHATVSISVERSIFMPGKSLEGQVALVTGAAKRIGRSIALRLAADGADIVVNYLSSQVEADALVRQIELSGRRALAVQGDVAVRADVQELFTAIEAKFGRLDILVNNAGTFFAAKFGDLTEEQWDRILDTNLKSQFLCAQAAAPTMKRQGRGRIINISSLGGILAWPGYTHYCGSRDDSVSGRGTGRGLHRARSVASRGNGRRHRGRRGVSCGGRFSHGPGDRRRWRESARVAIRNGWRV